MITIENLEASTEDSKCSIRHKLNEVELALENVDTIEYKHLLNTKKLKKDVIQHDVTVVCADNDKPKEESPVGTIISQDKIQIIMDNDFVYEATYDNKRFSKYVRDFTTLRNHIHNQPQGVIITIDLIIDGDAYIRFEHVSLEILFRLLKLPNTKLVTHINSFSVGTEILYLMCKYCNVINTYEVISGLRLCNNASVYYHDVSTKAAFTEQLRTILNTIRDRGFITDEEIEETLQHQNPLFIDNQTLMNREITEI
jgi:hypothetical protein